MIEHGKSGQMVIYPTSGILILLILKIGEILPALQPRGTWCFWNELLKIMFRALAI